MFRNLCNITPLILLAQEEIAIEIKLYIITIDVEIQEQSKMLLVKLISLLLILMNLEGQLISHIMVLSPMILIPTLKPIKMKMHV